MSHSPAKPAANVHLGKEAFALLKAGGWEGLWFSQGCEPVRFYHVSGMFVMGLYMQAVIVNQHFGCDCLLLL